VENLVLYLLARELRASLAETELVQIRRAGDLSLFEFRDDGGGGTLCLLTGGGGPWIWLEAPGGARRLSGEATRVVAGGFGRVTDLDTWGLDRILLIDLADGEGEACRLVLRLFGARGGWSLLRGGGRMAGFGTAPDPAAADRAGAPSQLPRVDPPGSELRRYLEGKGPPPEAPSLWGLGRDLELRVRRRTSEAGSAAEVLEELRRALRGTPRLGLVEAPEGRGPLVLPLVLPHTDRAVIETYPDALAAAAARGRALLQERQKAERRNELDRLLRRRIDRAQRKVEARRRALEKSAGAERYRSWAELLAAHRHRLARGMEEITLEGFDETAPPVTIPLDPAGTPEQNIESLFREARRRERGAETVRRLLEDARRERDLWLGRREEASEVSDPEALGRMMESWGERSADRPLRKGKSVSVPFRRFRLEGRWEAWVGRNNRENDLLTHRHASPRELWFHAQGVAGSHVVLKGPPHPPRTVVEAAARIAAHYSKARHSSLVPVIYTEKRYVRKPRGSPPGTASCAREKTLFVPPELPRKGR
jgi:hypothetical protein